MCFCYAPTVLWSPLKILAVSSIDAACERLSVSLCLSLFAPEQLPELETQLTPAHSLVRFQSPRAVIAKCSYPCLS